MKKKEGAQTTRDRIIDAALRLFSREGYLGATTKAIAKEAGIAEITLFRHFPSKEDLFEAVISTKSFLPTLRGLLPEIEERPYEEALATIGRSFLGALTLKKDLIRIMHSEIHRYPEKVRGIQRSMTDELVMTLASWFRRLQGKGLLRGFDAEIGAKAFLGMLFSHFTRKEITLMEGMTEEDRESTVREFVAIFVHGTLVGK